MKRKRYPVYSDGNNPSNIDSFNNQPKCTICLERYTNRTFVRDCFHSFCFLCIRQWINIVPECPLCKGVIHALIYNIIEDLNTYQEYRLADKKPNATKHHPTITGNDPSSIVTTVTGRFKQAQQHRPWLKRRRALYRYLPSVISYPQPLPRLSSLSIVQPDHIPKIIPFLKSELQAILGVAYDPFIEVQLESILLIPYNTIIKATNTNRSDRIMRDNKITLPMSLQQHHRPTTLPPPQPSSSPIMTMYDSTVVNQLSDWLNESDRVIRRLLDELLAYLKSGRSYIDFINTAQYQQIQRDKDDDDDDDDDILDDSYHNDPGPSSMPDTST